MNKGLIVVNYFPHANLIHSDDDYDVNNNAEMSDNELGIKTSQV